MSVGSPREEDNMKRTFVLALLVVLLTLGFLSCDANIRSNIADLMGNLSGNVYTEGGLIEPDTSAAADANTVVNTMGSTTETADPVTKKIELGTTLDVSAVDPDDAGNTLAPIAAQTEAEQDSFKQLVSEVRMAGDDSANMDEFLSNLEEPVTDTAVQDAAVDTIKFFNATLSALETELTGSGAGDLATTLGGLEITLPDDPSTLTQGDILALQLVTNLVSNTVATLESLIDTSTQDLTDIDTTDLSGNSDALVAILDDALFTSSVLEDISGVSTLNLTGTLLDGLSGMFSEDDGSGIHASKVTDSETFDLSGLKDEIGVGTVNELVSGFIPVFGIAKNASGDFTYDTAAYEHFLLNQQAYKASIDQAISLYRLAGEPAELGEYGVGVGTLIKYMLSVFVTTFDDYYNQLSTSPTSPLDSIPGVVVTFLNANKNFANGALDEENPGVMTVPNGYKTMMDGIGGYLDQSLNPKHVDLTRLANQIKTLVKMAEYSGIEDLDAELDKLPSTIESWFSED